MAAFLEVQKFISSRYKYLTVVKEKMRINSLDVEIALQKIYFPGFPGKYQYAQKKKKKCTSSNCIQKHPFGFLRNAIIL